MGQLFLLTQGSRRAQRKRGAKIFEQKRSDGRIVTQRPRRVLWGATESAGQIEIGLKSGRTARTPRRCRASLTLRHSARSWSACSPLPLWAFRLFSDRRFQSHPSGGLVLASLGKVWHGRRRFLTYDE